MNFYTGSFDHVDYIYVSFKKLISTQQNDVAKNKMRQGERENTY